jgi:2-oxoglutarate/2-oxoacid ferredoxin oxidoreductase subunit beta
MTERHLPILDTSGPPQRPAKLVDDFTPALINQGAHHLCPGCGEPIAMRLIMEAVEELKLAKRTVAVFGIGCYTAYSNNLDVEVVQALHGRSPSVATGVKRALPGSVVLTVQGDGDMVNEGLQEVLHTAARGEKVTCFLLNNGVFGETGGHMTAATVLGQRTKNTLEGRSAEQHGYPIVIGDLIAGLAGVAYAARGAVNTYTNVARTKRMVKDALEIQVKEFGFSFVEILTMCPTGWFIETGEAPQYLDEHIEPTHRFGVIKSPPSAG